MTLVTQGIGIPLRRCPAPTLATFSDLPVELLLRIAAEFHTTSSLRKLRPLCRLFNEMYKDLACGHLALGENLDKIDAMLSEPNTFDESCHKIRLNASCAPRHSGWTQISRLVGKMKGIRTIEWSNWGSLDAGVVDAISHLPHLENLEITFTRDLSGINHLMRIPRSSLCKLRSLSLQFTCLQVHRPCDFSDAKTVLCYLIVNATALEHLDVGPSVSRNTVRWDCRQFDIDHILDFLRAQHAYRPSLQSIKHGMLKLPGYLQARKILAQLSCLELTNNRREDDAVWPALRDARIKLATIKVIDLSIQLMDYLRSYQGVSAFHMRIRVTTGFGAPRYVEDETLQALLTNALLGHKETLVDLRFLLRLNLSEDRDAAERRPQTMLWDIPAVLANLQPFSRIERLDLVHYGGVHAIEEDRRAVLVTNLKAIACHSAFLETVCLNFIAVKSEQEFHGVLRCMSELQFVEEPLNSRELQVVLCLNPDLPGVWLRGYQVPLTRVAHKVACVNEEEGIFGLVEDIVATELLNERRWALSLFATRSAAVMNPTGVDLQSTPNSLAMSSISDGGHEASVADDEGPLNRENLSTLPPEILLWIFSKVTTKIMLRRLRLVCCAFNNLAKDLVADRVIIRGQLAQVDDMASEPNVFIETCRVLRLQDHRYPPDHAGWTALAKVVTKLRNVHTVQWIVEESLDAQVFGAIYQLPLLDNLSLAFNRQPSESNIEQLMLLGPKVSTLKKLSLQFSSIAYLKWDMTEVRRVLSYIIANGTALQHLEIGPAFSRFHNGVDLLELNDLFRHLPRRPNFTPSLQSFAPMSIQFPFANGQEDRHIWPTLQSTPIRLSTIKVRALSPELNDYIHSYQGLRVFRTDICDTNGNTIPDTVLQSFLTWALPRHTATMVDLRFTPTTSRAHETRIASFKRPLTLWNTQGILTDLQPFAHIERLDLVRYRIDSTEETEKATLAEDVHAVMMHSAALKTVYLHFVGLINEHKMHDAVDNPWSIFQRILRHLRGHCDEFSGQPPR
ncbi:hypothetical protein NMY22_g15058 [Coprinellus aureogranulatus]|nr:hypothetical protein NMY22_g15058 [Coprinellus aureogranulatus]